MRVARFEILSRDAGIFLGNLFLEKYLGKNLGNFQGAAIFILRNVHLQAEARFVKRLKLNTKCFYQAPRLNKFHI